MAFGDVFGLVSAMFLPVDSPCQIPLLASLCASETGEIAAVYRYSSCSSRAKVTLVAGTSGTTRIS